MLRELPKIKYKGKLYYIDKRLQELRYMIYGHLPEFIPINSKKGKRILKYGIKIA